MAWLQSTIPFIGILLLFQKTAQIPSQRYHLITDSLTWYEAQSFCRVKYSDLATVNNMDDKNELDKTLGGRTTYSWIGLLRGGTRRWMWSDGRGRAHFTKWNDGEPSNDNNKEWCGEISQKTGWNDSPCGGGNDFVCYDRQSNGNPKYVHYRDGKSWVASQELCRSQHTDLAYVSTSTENSEIADLVKSWTGIIGFNNKAWFGLFNDAWMWSDGAQNSFRYWQSGMPNSGHCAVSQQGRWVDINCNNKAAFVCQGGLRVKKMVIRIKVCSDADLTDSAVSDAILKKFETRLKDQFVTDFNVRWRSDKNGVIFQRHEQLEVAEKTGC